MREPKLTSTPGTTHHERPEFISGIAEKFTEEVFSEKVLGTFPREASSRSSCCRELSRSSPVFMFSLYTMETPRKQPNKLCLRCRFRKPKHETPNGQRKVPGKDPVILSRLFHRLQSSVQTQLFRQGNVGDKLLQHELGFELTVLSNLFTIENIISCCAVCRSPAKRKLETAIFISFHSRGFGSQQFEIENKTSDPSIAGFEQVWLI